MKEKDQQLSVIDPSYLVYREKISRSVEKGDAGFRAHLIPWVAVNTFLVFLNIFTSPGFPWAAFPAAGWGIGLITHYAGVLENRRRKRDIEKLPKLNRHQFRILRKIHRKRGAFRAHLVSNAAVSGFLCMVNLITSPGFLWFLIPTAGMAMGVTIHWSNFFPVRRKLRKDLKQALEEEGVFTSVTDNWPGETPKPALLMEAERIQAGVLKHLQDLGTKSHSLGEDIPGILSNYVKQIGILSGKGREMDHVIREMPVKELRDDRNRLEQRLHSTDESLMKREYRKSIEEIDRQLNSCEEIGKHREILDLRVNSALNNLKQMQLDLVRMKSMGTDEQTELEILRERTKELSLRLNDLTEGYDELEF